MVQSIDRAMKIINLLASDPQKTGWPISEIANNIHLPLSTVHRLISSLMRYELIAQLPETKHYKLGHKWMEIGLGMLEKLDLRSVARPHMEQLAERVEESIYLNIPNETDSIIIERVDSPLSVRIIDNLGERIPLHIGAANKTILAFMKKDKAAAIIHELQPYITDQSALKKQLTTVHKNGYAISYGEKTEGTAAIAAPIIGYDQQVIGALSIGVLSYTITDDRLTYLITEVKNTAKQISLQLGR
jgi:DNA-binding IclR family transcriptional regulator